MARILIIEDNPANLELMRYLLTAFGHQTASARDGARGLKAAFEDPPDLIICDLQMPGLNGFEVIARLRAEERLRAIPCIAVTALAMPEDQRNVVAAGFSGYITKPISPEGFAATIESFLRPRETAAARIMVVDDRPTNREFLTTLLGYAGHRLIEADSGASALEKARTERPDLIITDILMPTMDGFEFVQRLRADPEIGRTRVIFYSATYSVPDAEIMARACGVRTVLPKPADPQMILEVVSRELGRDPVAVPVPRRPYGDDLVRVLDPGAGTMDASLEACVAEMRSVTRMIEEMASGDERPKSGQDLLQSLSQRFSTGLAGLQQTTARLSALEDLSVRLLAEHSPGPMVETFAQAAARILGADRAAVCVLDPTEHEVAHLAGQGFDATLLRPFALDRTRVPGSLLSARAPLRLSGGSLADALPGELAGAASILGLPIRRGRQLHGWMLIADRHDGVAFKDEDVRVAESMAARLAVVYENAVLYDTVQRHAARLQVETGERERSRAKLQESEQRFRQIAENIREVFWLTDPAKNEMLYISPAYDAIWGRKADTLYTSPQDWLLAIHPEDRTRVQEAATTRQALGTYAEEYRIVRPDGSVRWIMDKAFPVRDEGGRVYRIAGVAEDITDKRATEAEIRRSHRALQMLSSCNEALIRAEEEQPLLDRICRIAVEPGSYRLAVVAFALQDEARSLVIKATAGDIPEGFRDHPRSWAPDGPFGQAPAARVIRTGRHLVVDDVGQEAAFRDIESSLQTLNLGAVVYLPLGDGGPPIGVLALGAQKGANINEGELRLLRELADDLAFGLRTIRARAERQRADEALKVSLGEKEALLKEVHHRVKNNLQVITSLLRLESSRVEEGAARDTLRSMQDRIHAMAVLHETLYRSDNVAAVDLSVYLRQLGTQLMRSLGSSTAKVGLDFDLAPLRIDMDRAIPCGLIVNELLSNALKHAFPQGGSGAVRVSLHVDGDGQVRLSVADDGVGLPRDLGARRERSLGLKLVSDLAKQLQGVLEIRPGPVFEVSFKVAETLPRA